MRGKPPAYFLSFFMGFCFLCFTSVGLETQDTKEEEQNLYSELDAEMEFTDIVSQSLGSGQKNTPTSLDKKDRPSGTSYVVGEYKTYEEYKEHAMDILLGTVYRLDEGIRPIFYESEEAAFKDRSNRHLGESYVIRTQVQKKAASRGYK